MEEQIDKLEEIEKLKEEIEKLRSQFYIFYELTKAMRTTLYLDEVVYIILTGLTAHQGLSFNRAILFLATEDKKDIQGFMGIGPMYGEEAHTIWRSIEEQKMDLDDLIRAYHHIKEEKAQPKFMEFVKSLSFPLVKENSLLFDAFFERGTLHIKEDKLKKFKADPLIQKLELRDFLISSIWIKDKPIGVILVDNYITKKPISEEDVRIFNMFVDQAQGAIENSQAFEDTLLKAHTDNLTALWNYGYFQYRLDEELARAKAKNYPFSIMMIDLDDFKKFNDTRGHLEGDLALKEIGAALKQSIRKTDILCRYGGEEFSLIVPYTTKEEASQIGEKMRKSLEEKTILNHKFTASIGIASFPADAQDKEVLVRKADGAMYDGKRAGKNKVTLA